jgi:Nitrogen regulatory protein PII
MKMIKAIVRPEKASKILNALCDEGYTSATRISILGRGKQQGLKVGDVYYDEIPKEMIMMVVEDDCVEKIKKLLFKVQEQINKELLVMAKFLYFLSKRL